MNHIHHQRPSAHKATLAHSTLTALLGVLTLASLPTPALAAETVFNLKWVNTSNAKDSFVGTLKLDAELASKTGNVNLASTTASLALTVPQLKGASYTMADFKMFSVDLSPAAFTKELEGKNLVKENLVTQMMIYGKVGSPAHKNFNACNNSLGVCLNREATGPVYNLVSMTSGK